MTLNHTNSTIQVNNLSRFFGSRKVVDNITFSVERGQVIGLLGPNGAGKSTVLRMITGCLEPDSGEILINGHSLSREPILAKRCFGYLPESAACFPEMTVTEFLKYSLKMRQISSKLWKPLIERAISRCYLQGVKNQLIATLSKGYLHRTCLAQSIVHDPDIFIFDEPTDGLDPNQKREFRELIQRLSHEKAILFSTHILEEVEKLCTGVVLVNHGRVVASLTPDDMAAKDAASKYVSIIVKGSDFAGFENLLGSSLEVSFSWRVGSCSDTRIYDLTFRTAKIGKLLRVICDFFPSEKLELIDFIRSKNNLEAAFQAFTIGSASDKEYASTN